MDVGKVLIEIDFLLELVGDPKGSLLVRIKILWRQVSSHIQVINTNRGGVGKISVKYRCVNRYIEVIKRIVSGQANQLNSKGRIDLVGFPKLVVWPNYKLLWHNLIVNKQRLRR